MNKPKLHKRKDVTRRYSFKALAAAGALHAAWLTLPANLVAAVPDWAKLSIVGVVLGAGVLGSFVDQGQAPE